MAAIWVIGGWYATTQTPVYGKSFACGKMATEVVGSFLFVGEGPVRGARTKR